MYGVHTDCRKPRLPTRDTPDLAACSMIGSGLRIFVISDVEKPVEVAYFNKPGSGGASALSQPAWDPTAVLMKANGPLGQGYMTFIEPFRHLVVYPALLRTVVRRWAEQEGPRLVA